MVKKTTRISRLISIMLISLLVLQLPCQTFAASDSSDDSHDLIQEASDYEDSDALEEETDQTSMEEASGSEIQDNDEMVVADCGEASEPKENLIAEDAQEALEIVDEEDADEGAEEIEVSEETEEGELLNSIITDDETEIVDVSVKVSVSLDGAFINDANGDALILRDLTLSGQNSYTIEEAVIEAHKLYYKEGINGYESEYITNPAGYVLLQLDKLWGYQRSDLATLAIINNNVPCNTTQLDQNKIKDGDYLHICLSNQPSSTAEKLSFFTDFSKYAAVGQTISLELKQSKYNLGKSYTAKLSAYKACEGTEIFLDGKSLDLFTDENGLVEMIIPNDLVSGEHFITAQKSELDVEGNTKPAITAACVSLEVYDATESQNKPTISRIYGTCISGSETLDDCCFDQAVSEENNILILPYGVSRAENSRLYLGAEIEGEASDDCSIYAVYEDPKTGSNHRVALHGETYLSRAFSQGTNYSSYRTKKIYLEIYKGTNLLSSTTIAVKYHLSPILYISYSNGNEEYQIPDIASGEFDWEIYENSESYTFQVAYDRRMWPELQITIDGEETSKKIFTVSDWSENNSLVIQIQPVDEDSEYLPAEYNINFVNGGIDYTPTCTGMKGQRGLIEQYTTIEEPMELICTVPESGDGTFEYQWYNYDYKKYDIIEGATDEKFYPPTDVLGLFAYSCDVSYIVDGKKFTRKKCYHTYTFIYTNDLEEPEFESQPESAVCLQGQSNIQLSAQCKKTSSSSVETIYQWYKNTQNSTEGGTLINGATNPIYTPPSNKVGTTYYYCEIYNQLVSNSIQVYSDKITTNVAEVTVKSNSDWKGNGTEGNPYLIQNASDLEILQDRVNSGEMTMEDTYFQMTADIELPSDWTPLGDTLDHAFRGIIDGDGHTLTVSSGGLPLLGYVNGAEVKNLNIYGEKIAGYGLVNYLSGTGIVGDAIVIDHVTLKSGSSTLKSGLIGANLFYSSYAGVSAKFITTIKNCVIEEGVTVGYAKDQSMIGGIAGRLQGTIENCECYADVYGTDYVGGIVGSRDNAMGDCAVIGCAFGGAVTASGEHAGGIVGGGYSNDSAPNGIHETISDCTSAGTIVGKDKVGGILGGDSYIAQSWDNGIYTMKNNTFTGTVKATGGSYIGGIIGYYKSLNRVDDISNNTYAENCGAAKGIGQVGIIDTSCANPTAVDGTTYVNTETDTSGCPTVKWCGWLTGYNRTDDPLGADAEKLTKVIKSNYTGKIKVSLSTKAYSYNGKVKTPKLTVTADDGTILKKGTDYTVSVPKGRKKVGTYTYKIKLQGIYTGSKSISFKILPKATTVKSLSKAKKQTKVTWKKTSEVSGYQIQYSLKMNFSSKKTVTVKGKSKTSKTIKKLKSGKKYYVRIRTYKTVNGKTYYSTWSKTNAVKVK